MAKYGLCRKGRTKENTEERESNLPAMTYICNPMMNILCTIGDCNGIGIEVLLKAFTELEEKELFPDVNFRVIAHAKTLGEYIQKTGSKARIEDDSLIIGKQRHSIIACSTEARVELGKESPSAGALAAEALEIAVQMLLQQGADAMVTMPVSKHALHLTGWNYPGQTEMLAARCGVATPQMILCTKSLRVALATIHVPLRDVPALVSTEGIVKSVRLLHESLCSDFALPQPRIAVLGLNPHAGEQGQIGSEEEENIIPAIIQAQQQGWAVEGPFPADGFFAHGEYRRFDGILAMYHDQGLIPLKLLAGGAGVNVTAALPIVRTSPDHGTAFAIAGKGIASHESVLQAIETAVMIASHRRMTR